MTSQQIRQAYLDFFVQKHGHTFVPSSPVVPQDDPTLLFTNAGMNQFKPIFLGQEKRAYTRAVNMQKCIRAGGKHNDLDDVGRSRRHGTFFEMLGNWSFGDYFKRGAIEMAWELITKIFKLDPARIHVTCYEGDPANNVPRDMEAADLWKKVAGMPDDHIHFLGKQNFWEMGETGPCGPCTEIFIDRTPGKTGGPSVVAEDDPRVMEFWNLVFIQYNRNADRSLTPLPAQHVDTGMGFERICSIMQDKQDMFGIDLFDPFWAALTDLTGIKYGGTYPKTNAPDPAAEAASPELRHDIAFRVIADHLRTLTFALTDGAVPSNEGRGYVLRRILRRAVRFGRQQLELREPFMHKLVPVVVESMGGAFPELKKNTGRVVELIKDEEISFSKTLERGLAEFETAQMYALGEAIAKRSGWRFGMLASDRFGINKPTGLAYTLRFADAGNQSHTVTLRSDQFSDFVAREKLTPPQIPDEYAFKLHDTYGFPIDLTRIMAEERGMTVDIAGYEKLMEEAREKARSAGGHVSVVQPLIEILQRAQLPATEFAGYSHTQVNGQQMKVWLFKNQQAHVIPVDHMDPGDEGWLVTERTPFYAESGGQVGDTGIIQLGGGGKFQVEDTIKLGSIHFHRIRLDYGPMQALVGQSVVSLRVREDRRRMTMQNHTATHLANWALRETLGEGVQQKGSLVDPEKLRFDFSHGKSLSDEEIAKVESLVADSIAKKLPVNAQEAPQEQALKINGLRAVFGEKYPPMVRVVSIGAPVDALLKEPSNDKWRQYSIEFCGGTHLSNSAEVEKFVITSEESVSKGVRRLVAHTGVAASAAMKSANDLQSALDRATSLSESELPQTINQLQKQIAGEGLPLRAKRHAQSVVGELQAKYKSWEKSQKSAGGSIDIASVAADLLSKGNIVVAPIDGASDDQLRTLIDSIKKRSPSFAAMLAATDGQKVSFVAAVSDDLIAKGLKAGDWVRETAKVAGGGGGGRPQMAQAGGKDPSKLGEALEVARSFAGKFLS